MTGVADIDAGRVLVLHRQGRQLGAGFGLFADLLGDACGAVNGGQRLLQGVHGLALASSHWNLQDSDGERTPRATASGGGVGTGTSRPNGINRDVARPRRRLSPNEWAENVPQPNRTIGPSASSRTIDVTGIDAGRQTPDTVVCFPQFLAQWCRGIPAGPRTSG